MKTIGLIGGITPQSTILYYQILNDFANKTFKGVSSCKTLIHSFNFEEISALQGNYRKWPENYEILRFFGRNRVVFAFKTCSRPTKRFALMYGEYMRTQL